MSVNARVVLLVEDDTSLYIPCRVGNSWGSHMYVHDGYMRTNKKIDSHITKIRRPFRRSVLKILREPVSVNARVILLVEYNKTLYIPCRV